MPKKYEGLDGTELAISESQERMAVVIEPENKEEFLRSCRRRKSQGLVPVAVVTEDPRLVRKWNGKEIVNVAANF